jgi:predicted ATPase
MDSKSNWYVITGGPSSGKKTVLNYLKAMGYLIIREAARGVIDRAKRQGITTKELRRDEVKFQESLLPIKLRLEQKLPRDRVIFWNRAMPDSIAYLINCGGDPQKALVLCEPNLYRKVFLLNPLPFTPDYARTEDAKTAHRLNRLLREAYEQIGYKVILVPRMSPIPQLSIARRLAFILTHVYEEEVE